MDEPQWQALDPPQRDQANGRWTPSSGSSCAKSQVQPVAGGLQRMGFLPNAHLTAIAGHEGLISSTGSC